MTRSFEKKMIIGAAAGNGGLVWMIFEKGDNLDTEYFFAALFMVIVIGLLVALHWIYKHLQILAEAAARRTHRG